MVATSETKVEILPAIPARGKTIFPGDHTPLRKVLLQDAKVSADMQEKLNGVIHALKNIVSSSLNDICYIRLIEMDIESEQNLPAIVSEPYKLPLKHQG